MVMYARLGNVTAEQVMRLSQLLARHGAVETSMPQADLLLIGAETVANAAALCDSIDSSRWSTVLLVGVDGQLDVRRPAAVGTLAGLLERYRPLGAMLVAEHWNPDLAGFIGAKDLAESMDAGFAKQFSSMHYASWFRCAGDDAGDFVLRLLTASRSLNTPGNEREGG